MGDSHRVKTALSVVLACFLSWMPGACGGYFPDTDGDGLADDVDQCDLRPEDKDGFRDDDGCPDRDDDEDGILDKDDKCPLVPEDRDSVEDDDGCPDLDEDEKRVAEEGHRGIDGPMDECPDELEDMDGVADEDGCPEEDGDGDRIPDAVDECPLEAEVYNGRDDEDGCPNVGVVGPVYNELNEDSFPLLEFPAGSLDMRGMEEILEAMSATFYNNPQLDEIAIVGHASDKTKSSRGRIKLSKKRANIVLKRLVKLGVKRRKLVAIGVGDVCTKVERDQPEDRERTRAANRYVEFIVTTLDETPTCFEVACNEAYSMGLVDGAIDSCK